MQKLKKITQPAVCRKQLRLFLCFMQAVCCHIKYDIKSIAQSAL